MSPATTSTNEDLDRRKRPCRHFVRHIPKAALGLIALALAFWLLWNWAAVPLFIFPPLTYLQGLVAILLTVLLTSICMIAVVHRRRSAENQASSDNRGKWGCRFGSTWKRDI